MLTDAGGFGTMWRDRPTRGVVTHWETAPLPGVAGGRITGVSIVLCTYRRADSAMRFLASVASQARPVDEVIIVDASPDTATERAMAEWRGARRVSYWRVEDPLRGLTRQRNFGLSHVSCDIVAFFDDDVVLAPTCVEEMSRPLRQSADIAGVGCFAETWSKPTALWRTRRALRIVSGLEPGRYTRSGMSVPWRFHEPTTEVVEGDWLPGCAMMARTADASELRFDEALSGYAQGEDLEFSLRLRKRGRVVIAGAAQCQHFHAPAGRPDAFKLGQMEIWNRYRIWRRVHSRPNGGDLMAFTYAWALDTVLLARDAIRPQYAAAGLRRIAGRVSGAWRLLRERPIA